MLFSVGSTFRNFFSNLYSYIKKYRKPRNTRALHVPVINAFMLVVLLAPNITTVTQAAAPLLDDLRFGSLFSFMDSPSLNLNASDYQAPQFEHAEGIVGERPSEDLQALLEENDVEAPPMLFVENVGQFEEAAQFKVQGPQSTIFFAKDAIWVSLLDMASFERAQNAEDERFSAENPLEGIHLKLDFSGANKNVHIAGFDPINTKVSYLSGKDSDTWETQVPVWGGLRYKEIYPGIDLEVTSEDGQWVWRFVYGDTRSPVIYERFTDYGDLSTVDVGLIVQGANELELKDAALRVKTDLGDVTLPLVEIDQLSEFSEVPEQEYAADLKGEELENPFSVKQSQPEKNDFLLPESGTEPEASNAGLLAAPMQAPLAAPPAVPDDLLYSTFFGSPGGHAAVDIEVTSPNVVYIAIQGGSQVFR